jgi:hypothetical protein
VHRWLGHGSGTTSGSGRVGVVPLERGDQGGSNGTKYDMAVAVLTEIWSGKVGG